MYLKIILLTQKQNRLSKKDESFSGSMEFQG